jgi:cellulose biosynthesis protein BcsQ
MYVVTFYSFKGGVGRTMALVNVAAELAKQGRKVLMVDFDLEAPGLSDFELIPKEGKKPGLVEFIATYTATNEVPDVKHYLYCSNKFQETEDRLWVMPAGCHNGDYQSLFSSINWTDLYEKKNGYLLMEDLRAQWQSALEPDYVFIDSRTGYTDIAGICTRQLPDAVCMLFTPNKQNLTGLTRITSEIKMQKGTPGLRSPKIHFVASNIPSLDDDENVLEKALGTFSRQLEYVKPSAIIHHYNSFALINEAVFTIEYPKNPLASEYRSLANEITRENFKDRKTAINFLRSTMELSSQRADGLSEKEVDGRLERIELDFSNDPDVLFWLSRARRALGSLEESEIVLDAAIRKGLNTPRGYLDRAIFRINRQIDRDDEAIWADLSKILEMENGVLPSELLWTIKLANRIGYGSNEQILAAAATHSLKGDEVLHVADKLHDSKSGASITVGLITDAIESHRIADGVLDDALNVLAISYIALGRLEEAIRAIEKTTSFQADIVELTSAFNYGMAKYWIRDQSYTEYFSKVVRILGIDTAAHNANHLQCLSFCHFSLGNLVEAYALLDEAMKRVNEQPGQTFSCWRYLEVAPSKFKDDLAEMGELYEGKKIVPIFYQASEFKF